MSLRQYYNVETWQVIRARREELGLSQSVLADLVGIDVRMIRRYETGDTQPTLPVAAALASALGLTLDELASSRTLTGDWRAVWQDHDVEVHVRQHGPHVLVSGAPRGELRLLGDTLVGWCASGDNRCAIYLELAPDGLTAAGQWVGPGGAGQLTATRQ